MSLEYIVAHVGELTDQDRESLLRELHNYLIDLVNNRILDPRVDTLNELARYEDVLDPQFMKRTVSKMTAAIQNPGTQNFYHGYVAPPDRRGDFPEAKDMRRYFGESTVNRNPYAPEDPDPKRPTTMYDNTGSAKRMVFM